jgi:hypothetical protein
LIDGGHWHKAADFFEFQWEAHPCIDTKAGELFPLLVQQQQAQSDYKLSAISYLQWAPSEHR